MTHEFRAIFEHGILRPLDPISLAENDVVTVVVQSNGSRIEHSAVDDTQQKKNLMAALAEANRLPLESPDDGFSGADHDQVLYGRQE
jgi:predicted DNA-binding antitoxin AbrB/MazE fold protein